VERGGELRFSGGGKPSRAREGRESLKQKRGPSIFSRHCAQKRGTCTIKEDSHGSSATSTTRKVGGPEDPVFL